MKVMCIKDFENADGFEPVVGEVVTVVGESNDYKDTWYISEYPTDAKGNRQSFVKQYFIPLSDICETELAKQREELQTV